MKVVCATHNVTKRPCRVVSRSASMDRFALVCRTGNAVEIPQPNDPTKKFTCKYDAWNRLIEVRDFAGKFVAEYRFDAFGRRHN